MCVRSCSPVMFTKNSRLWLWLLSVHTSADRCFHTRPVWFSEDKCTLVQFSNHSVLVEKWISEMRQTWKSISENTQSSHCFPSSFQQIAFCMIWKYFTSTHTSISLHDFLFLMVFCLCVFQNQGWANPNESSESDQRWPALLLPRILLFRPFLSLSPSQCVRPARTGLPRLSIDAEPCPQAPGRRGEEGDWCRGHHLWDFSLSGSQPASSLRTNETKRR